MIEIIRTISLVFLFALGIMIGFIGGLAISSKVSPSSFPLCISIKDGENKNNNRCHHRREHQGEIKYPSLKKTE
ncbi:hypothetical protein R83H12_03141 [Fibrobacteria bacterium R8-3-H12]